MPLYYPCLSNLDLLWDHSITVSLRDIMRISTCFLTCYLVSWNMTFFHAQTLFYLRNPLNQTPAHTLPLQWNTFSPKDQKICAFFRCQKCTKYVLFLSARNAAFIVTAAYQVTFLWASCWVISIYVCSESGVTILLCKRRNCKSGNLSYLLPGTELTRCDLGFLVILTCSSSLISKTWSVLRVSPATTYFVFDIVYFYF